MSCKGCVFRETYHDMSWSCSVCTLHADLYQAIKACENSESCPYRFTVEEAKKIVFEKAGHLPVNYKLNDEPCVAPEQESHHELLWKISPYKVKYQMPFRKWQRRL